MKLSVKDFGAVGDGLIKDTTAIQAAIDKCSENGGGQVYLPSGCYLAGTIWLKDNVELRLEHAAELKASDDITDYNSDDAFEQNYVAIQEKVTGKHFIIAHECQNVAISGSGTINGNGSSFFDADAPLIKGKNRTLKTVRPGQLVCFYECTRVNVTGVSIQDAPYWTLFLHGCNDVMVSNLHIVNPFERQNGDGIDIDSCKNVTVSDCNIASGDDSITLRGNIEPLKNKSAVCENVVITNCILSTPCCAIRVGVGDGEVRNCVISNCVIHNTRTGICVISKYSPKRTGLKISNISFNNIVMDTVRPIYIGANIRGTQNEESKMIRNINFNHLRGSGCWSSMLEGNIDCNIKEIVFNDIVFDYSGGDDIEEGPGIVYGEFGTKAAPTAFHLANANDIVFDRVRINWKTDNPNWKYGIWTENVNNLQLRYCQLNKDCKLNGEIVPDTK